jgi:hypothetical protein
MEIVSNFKIQKEKGFLYFVGKDGFVYKVPLRHSKIENKEPQRVTNEPVKIEKGFVYFVNKEGFVCRAEQNKKGNPERRKADVQKSH